MRWSCGIENAALLPLWRHRQYIFENGVDRIAWVDTSLEVIHLGFHWFFCFLAFLAALKIHCSTACKQLLDRLGGYILEERGEIKIKGKGDMVTYWLVGEETGNQIRQRGRPNGPWPNRPKSSLRNHKLPRNRHNREDLASSLDSPKKLRFASDSPAAGPSTVDVEIMDETVPFVVTSKRNSCPNLKVNAQVGGFTLMQPSFSRSFERKLCYQPHRLSTTSLVEAITLSSSNSNNASNRTPNGKSQLHFTLSSPNSSRIRGENPKIELSPPEESMNDCWPLLDPHYASNENGIRDDRETSVWASKSIVIYFIFIFIPTWLDFKTFQWNWTDCRVLPIVLRLIAT